MDKTVSGIETGDSSQINQLADKLALANDEVNKAQQENIELRERLALLEAQVATMAALLEQAESTSTAERLLPQAKRAPFQPIVRRRVWVNSWLLCPAISGC